MSLPRVFLPRVPQLDDLLLLAATVKQEAEGEPWEGQLGVAWVIMNRAVRRGRSIADVVFDPHDFSAWNTDSPTRLRLDDIEPEVWAGCYKAACAAYFALVPDPTRGADHYLNPEAVVRLPSWYDPAKVTARIGRHKFLRLEGVGT